MSPAREATSHLVDLLRREHHALAEFLLALAAFDGERRWADLGYRSLFAFLNRELGLSKAATYYRLTAARLIQQHPAVVEPLRDGRLCYTAVVELSKVLTADNCHDVLPRFFHLSKREAADVRAALAPEPVVPHRVVVTSVRPAAVMAGTTALPLELTAAAPVSVDPRQQAVHPGELHGVSSPPATASPPPAPAIPVLVVEPKTAELSRIHLTVPRRLLRKLDAARDALSHSHPGASEDEILEVGLDLILQRHAKRRGLVAKPRKPKAPAPVVAAAGDVSAPPASPPPSPPAERSRHVPAHVAREVWERDQGRCQWGIDGGGSCGETYQVQIDHIDGWALGAGHDPARLRLLCRPHQDVHARKLYGDDLMDKYTGPKGGGCSEPFAEYAAGHRSSSCEARAEAAAVRPGTLSGRERAPPEPWPTRERSGRSLAASPERLGNVLWAGPRGGGSRARYRFGRSLSFDAHPARADRSAAPHWNIEEGGRRAAVPK